MTAPSRKEPLVCANIALSAFAVPRDSSLTLENDNVGRRFTSRSITKLLSFGADRRDAGPYKFEKHCSLVFSKINAENTLQISALSERKEPYCQYGAGKINTEVSYLYVNLRFI